MDSHNIRFARIVDFGVCGFSILITGCGGQGIDHPDSIAVKRKFSLSFEPPKKIFIIRDGVKVLGFESKNDTEEKNDVSVHKTDVVVHKTDVAVHKTDVAVHKTDMAVHKNQFTVMKTVLFSSQNSVHMVHKNHRPPP